jgi:hypothetical protein
VLRDGPFARLARAGEFLETEAEDEESASALPRAVSA